MNHTGWLLLRLLRVQRLLLWMHGLLLPLQLLLLLVLRLFVQRLLGWRVGAPRINSPPGSVR